MSAGKIMVVEDDLALSAGLCFELDMNGYLTVAAYNTGKARQLVATEEFDLVLLDVNLPDGNGMDLCRELKEECPQLPVIFLTANDLEEDVVAGFDLGADDYVTKPFTPMELMARVNSQLRRYRKFLEKLEVKGNVHVIGGLEINEDTVEVTVDGSPVKLTPLEFRILLLLAKNPGRVFSADEIYERVWQERAVNTDTVMVHVRNIREKIELDPKNPKYLKVVWGVGYKIEKQS